MLASSASLSGVSICMLNGGTFVCVAVQMRVMGLKRYHRAARRGSLRLTRSLLSTLPPLGRNRREAGLKDKQRLQWRLGRPACSQTR